MAYLSLTRAKQALPSSYNTADDPIVLSLIDAVSTWVDSYCNRSAGGFNIQSYDILFHGTGTRIYHTPDYPIQSITRISTYQVPCLGILNTDPDVGSRALVQYTTTSAILTKIKSNVTTTTTLLYSTYPTVNNLAAAINALGNNWIAQVMAGLGARPSTDIRPSQGGYGAHPIMSYAWTEYLDIPQFRVKESTGEIFSYYGFNRGVFNYRILYSAGYTSFPVDLEQALVELVQAAYLLRNLNPNLASESISGQGVGTYSYSRFTNFLGIFDSLSVMARNTIRRYKNIQIPKFSEW